MALWQIGDRAPGEHAGTVTPDPLANSSPIFVHSQENGTNKVFNPPDPSDPYGGTPINLNTGSSAAGLQSLSGVLGSGFEGLFNLISQNTDKNNAWSAEQAQKQMNFQERMQQIAMDYNSLEAAKSRDWQQMMSNTAHQREVADLKAAGLNPILSASGGNGAAVTSGATAAGAGVPSGAKADADQSANSAMASIYGALISAQTQMYNANLAAKTNMYMSDRQVEASMYGAQMAANASMYGSQMAYNGTVYGQDQATYRQREMNDWNAAHPSNMWQATTSSPVQDTLGYVLNKAKDFFSGHTNPSAKSRSSSSKSKGYSGFTGGF